MERKLAYSSSCIISFFFSYLFILITCPTMVSINYSAHSYICYNVYLTYKKNHTSPRVKDGSPADQNPPFHWPPESRNPFGCVDWVRNLRLTSLRGSSIHTSTAQSYQSFAVQFEPPQLSYMRKIPALAHPLSHSFILFYILHPYITFFFFILTPVMRAEAWM